MLWNTVKFLLPNFNTRLVLPHVSCFLNFCTSFCHLRTSIMSLKLLKPTTWHIFEHSGEPNLLSLKESCLYLFIRWVICWQYSGKLKWSLPSFVCLGPGFRLSSYVDAVFFPASKRNSRIHLKFILVTWSASSLAVTVTVIPQVFQCILLRQECDRWWYFIPSKFSRQYTTFKVLWTPQ